MTRTLAATLISFAVVYGAATQSAVEPAYTGCVMARGDGSGEFTLCEPEECSLLVGKGVGPALAGRKVTVHGTVHAATPATPRTIVVDEVVSIGDACSETCTPKPPGTRGLGDEPGTQLGTPGAAPQRPPP